ncbi:adenylate kinase family enzyme [Tahibacter aquaticus]|uniref:Adenylate kinase family enzyme n=2 Tax=Tahibacter aquaticus TaxID=520092 RepID=A0A4R6ZA72_9GAMM|nr:adenylate kinase family enzyme [Tahibacter aquaticus]
MPWLPMRKLLLIGPGGSGKSTLAAAIASRTKIPVVHLDTIFWRAGWVETPREEWVRTVEGMIQADAWIMDGNYGGTLDRRLAACDSVVFLDMPAYLCVWRILRRRWQFRGRSRPDMAEGCAEKLGLDFVYWALSYRYRRRPAVLAKLEAARAAGKHVVVLASRQDVQAFLATL